MDSNSIFQIKDVFTVDGDVYAVLLPPNKKAAAQQVGVVINFFTTIVPRSFFLNNFEELYQSKTVP
jgi:hypothetical protein